MADVTTRTGADDGTQRAQRIAGYPAIQRSLATKCGRSNFRCVVALSPNVRPGCAQLPGRAKGSTNELHIRRTARSDNICGGSSIHAEQQTKEHDVRRSERRGGTDAADAGAWTGCRVGRQWRCLPIACRNRSWVRKATSIAPPPRNAPAPVKPAATVPPGSNGPRDAPRALGNCGCGRLARCTLAGPVGGATVPAVRGLMPDSDRRHPRRKPNWKRSFRPNCGRRSSSIPHCRSYTRRRHRSSIRSPPIMIRPIARWPRKGFTLRVRKAKGRRIQTPKSASASGGLAAHREWEMAAGNGSAGHCPDRGYMPAGGALDPGVVARLEPHRTTDIHRTIRNLRLGGGGSVEVAVDDGSDLRRRCGRAGARA